MTRQLSVAHKKREIFGNGFSGELSFQLEWDRDQGHPQWHCQYHRVSILAHCEETDMSLAERQTLAPDQPPRLFISLLGWLTIVLAVLMAIIPRLLPDAAVSSIGTLLMLAGFVEVLVGALAARWSTGTILATGLFTIVVAILTLLAGPHTFFTLSAIITIWLIGHAIALLILTFRAPWRGAMAWLLASGLANALLASLAILITMSVVIAHSLFGAVPRGAGYSAIPALSLLFTGVSFAAAAIAPRAEQPV